MMRIVVLFIKFTLHRSFFMESHISGSAKPPESRLSRWGKAGQPAVLAEKYGRKFYRQDFINPVSGEVEDFYLFSMKDSVFVFPITGEGKIITVRQYKQGCDDITHELPAGVCNQNELFEVTAKRELLEETGYEATAITSMGEGLPDTRCMTIRRFFFLATGCRKVREPERDPREEIEVIVLDVADWLYLIRRNQVKELTTTSLTLSALLRLGLIDPDECRHGLWPLLLI